MNHRFETATGDITVLVSQTHLKLVHENKIYPISFQPAVEVVERAPFSGEIHFEDGSILTYLVNRSEIFLHFLGETWSFRRKERELSLSSQSSPELKSPMPGKIIQMHAELGKKFAAGEIILILEAMKMENAIKAPFACTVSKIFHKLGEIVQQDEVIAILDKLSSEKT